MSFSFQDLKNKATLTFNREVSDDAEEQQPDRLEELAEYCPQLSFQQRLIGFLVSFSLGYMIAFFSFRFFIVMVAGNPIPFACNYTLGHILQLSASVFLCGPKRQFKNMFDEKRRTTSIVYLSCLGTTLLLIFLPFPSLIKLLLLLISMMTQFCASTWYSLSYIPFGRRTALRMLRNAFGLEDTSAGTGAGASYSNLFGASTSSTTGEA